MSDKKCEQCGKTFDEVGGKAVDILPCHRCGKFFCSQHLYAGNKQFKMLCAGCLTEIQRMERSVDKIQEENNILNKSESASFPAPGLHKWEYRSVYIPLHPMIMEQAISEENNENLLQKPWEMDSMPNPPLLNVDVLNQMGEKGWEVTGVIPQTSGVLEKHKNPKYFSFGGGMVNGIHVLLKRMKLR